MRKLRKMIGRALSAVAKAVFADPMAFTDGNMPKDENVRTAVIRARFPDDIPDINPRRETQFTYDYLTGAGIL